MNALKTPRFIQRLTSRKTESGFNIKPGIGKDGSNESRKLIKNFCEFDYMGSAEFEFGAIAKWFVEMANIAFSNQLKRWKIHYGREKLYIIGPSDLTAEITEQVEMLILGQYRLQEPSHIIEHLSGIPYYRCNGWLSLENPYIFSTDEKLIDKFCTFWGVK